jgi:hypothetical protein
LRHIAFFEALEREEDDSPRSRVVVAGMLVLRHIDGWVLAGKVMVEPESINVRSSREAIAALSPDNPQREVLFGVVNTMQTSREVDVMPLLPQPRTYAELVEREEWSKPLAADVYYTVSRLGADQLEEDQAAELLARLLRLIDPPN